MTTTNIKKHITKLWVSISLNKKISPGAGQRLKKEAKLKGKKSISLSKGKPFNPSKKI